MFRVLPDPAVLPSHVARRSIAVDLRDESTDLARAFGDLSLPASLHGAARKRRVEYLAGRWCAREAMRARHPALAMTELTAGDDRAPRWPVGVVGSITHTDGFVSAAVADAATLRGLGIDSERVLPLAQARRLAERFARPGELAALARGSGYDEATLATMVFSAKESVFKCLAPTVGEFFGFQAAEVVAVSAEGALRVRLVTSLRGGFRAGDELSGRVVVSATHVHTAVVLKG